MSPNSNKASFLRADLHCHSTCSDGSLTPLELIQHAKASDLNGLSITDHDSIEAYAIAVPAAKDAGIELISGVEFSAVHGNTSVHVLGYSFNPCHESIQALCLQHQHRRKDRNLAIIELLKKHNMPVTEEEVNACATVHSSIGRPHIAMAMMQKGYINNIQEAFKLYIGEGMPCFVRGDDCSVEQTIDVIHQAKGFAIIAHPHLIKEGQVVQDLLKMTFDGLEGYYARLSPDQNTRWVKMAEKRGWLITGGSDFHGDLRPNIPLGSSWTPEETFRILQKRYQENN